MKYNNDICYVVLPKKNVDSNNYWKVPTGNNYDWPKVEMDISNSKRSFVGRKEG